MDRQETFNVLIIFELVLIGIPLTVFYPLWLYLSFALTLEKLSQHPGLMFYPIALLFFGVCILSVFTFAINYRKYAYNGIPKYIYLGLISGGLFTASLSGIFLFLGNIIFIIPLFLLLICVTVTYEIRKIRKREILNDSRNKVSLLDD